MAEDGQKKTPSKGSKKRRLSNDYQTPEYITVDVSDAHTTYENGKPMFTTYKITTEVRTRQVFPIRLLLHIFLLLSSAASIFCRFCDAFCPTDSFRGFFLSVCQCSPHCVGRSRSLLFFVSDIYISALSPYHMSSESCRQHCPTFPRRISTFAAATLSSSGLEITLDKRWMRKANALPLLIFQATR